MILGYDWPRLHAALNDLPAALLLFSVLFDLAAWATKRESLRWAGIWTLWAGAVGGWAAVIAGEQASEAIEHGEAIHEIMELHERLALITMSVFTVILLWKLARRFRAAALEDAALKALSVVGVILLVRTAQLGGKMTFEHGAGMTAAEMQAEMQNRALGHHHHPGEADDDDDEHAAPDTGAMHMDSGPAAPVHHDAAPHQH